MLGSLEYDDHKINPVTNPWVVMTEEVDPEYVNISSKVWFGKRALPVTSEERMRIVVYASKSRQK